MKPKILTAEEWRRHCDRLDSMSVYMHSYSHSKSQSRSKVRSSLSASRMELAQNSKSYVGSPLRGNTTSSPKPMFSPGQENQILKEHFGRSAEPLVSRQQNQQYNTISGAGSLNQTAQLKPKDKRVVM